MKMVRHIIVVAAACFLILGIPFFRSDTFATLAGKAPDAVSGASVVIDQPSGEYVIFINRDRHPDEENLRTWIDFFEGKEITFLFEDITCMVAKGDALGLEMAQSLQSKLPENQMQIEQTEATLMLSKAEYGRYDVIIMSQEMAEAFRAETVSSYQGTIDIVRNQTDAEAAR